MQNRVISGIDKPLIDPSLTNENEGNSVTKRVNGKLVLRPSSINIHCPYSYAQNAILGKKSKPSGASQGGTAYHYAVELSYEHKIKFGKPLPTNDMVEIGVTNWEYATQVQEMKYAEGDSPERMKDNIAEGLKNYAPTMEVVKPIATEIRLNMALPKESNVYSIVSGSIDLLAEINNPLAGMQTGYRIIDHKFTSKKATEPKYRMQAGLYKMMANANGYNVKDTVLHNMVRGKQLKTKRVPTSLEVVHPTDNYETQVLVWTRINELIDRAELYHFLTTEMNIDPEDAVKVVYPTTTPEVSYLCNELWCGWWHSCYINNMANMPKVNLVEMLREYKKRKENSNASGQNNG